MQFKTLLVALAGLCLASLPLATGAPSLQVRTFGSWTVKNFTRSCPDPKTCTYDFIIATSAFNQACTFVDTVMSTALNHSFYDFGCNQASQWRISWGWDYPGDFTVMTVRQVNQPTSPNFRAFFGYNSPNKNIPATGGSASYPDNGPNAAQQE